MPTTTFNLIKSGFVRAADLTYPPASLFSLNSLGPVERSYDASVAQFRVSNIVLKFTVSGIPAGSTGFVYTLKLTVMKHDTNARQIRIDNYNSSWTAISAADFDIVELTGDQVAQNLSAVTNGDNFYILSGLPDLNGNVVLRLGISGGQPTGPNDLSISAATLQVAYSHSATPANISIDGNTADGITIPRDLVHRFAWATGGNGTRFQLLYKRTSDVAFVTIDQTTTNQYWIATLGLFSSGVDNTWQYKIREADDENNWSAFSALRSFITVGTLAALTVSPSGTTTSARPFISVTGLSTHTKERIRIYEYNAPTVVIYDTGDLTQTSGSHQVTSSGGNWRNGKNALEDGKTYIISYQITDSGGSIGTGSATVLVAFTPPAKPIVVITTDRLFVNINYQNPGSGAAVNQVDLLVSSDWNPVTNTGTWEVLTSGLPASTLTTNPNFQWYEARSGQLYYFKARAWSSPAFLDSDPVNATLLLKDWMTIHDTDDPTGTIIAFRGRTTMAGNESAIASNYSPRMSIANFVNNQDPSIDREVTIAGAQIVIEQLRVVTMIVIGDRLDDETFVDYVDTILRRPARFCLRTNERPLGLKKFGGITNYTSPSRRSNFAKEYPLSFEFTITR